ncbi:MAG TPA: hypothetical protein VFF69_11510 [Phycisphaerales bacterium]|nr:hypothetical protein [Phycisphaerales bacterium]
MRDDEFFIDPLRLIEAAEAVAEALAEVADASTGRCPYPPALLGMPEHPECLDPFTTEELEEATAFLCRLGILVHRPQR